MRPNDKESSSEVYECFECGERTGSAEGLKCPACGGELKNLGLPRDL